MTWQDKLISASTFTWLGFLCAISFMEAWLKFQAPGITLELGLGIGQLVFGALNKVELSLALLIAFLCVKRSVTKGQFMVLFLLVLILAVQTIYLLPTLDKRANLILNGIEPEKSYLHFIYILVELIKAVALIVFGVQSFK